jgi:hypothetical protein
MRPDPEEISHAFVTHLGREEATLIGSLEVLRRVRAALLRSDLDELTALRDPQERAAAESARLRAERDQLRARLAVALGLSPQRVSISTLTAALPPAQREPLRGAGDRLRRLAVEADGLVRSNAALLSHLLRFTRRFLSHITGGEEAAGCYGPDGTHLEASFGSLLSTKG